MAEYDDFRQVLVITLYYIFKVIELEGGVDIERESSNAIKNVTGNIQSFRVLYPIVFMVTFNKMGEDFLQLRKFFMKKKNINRTIEGFER